MKTIDHPQHGPVRLLGFAPRMSRSEVAIERAPLLGEHTHEVLAAELRLEESELAKLSEQGAVRQAIPA